MTSVVIEGNIRSLLSKNLSNWFWWKFIWMLTLWWRIFFYKMKHDPRGHLFIKNSLYCRILCFFFYLTLSNYMIANIIEVQVFIKWSIKKGHFHFMKRFLGPLTLISTLTYVLTKTFCPCFYCNFQFFKMGKLNQCVTGNLWYKYALIIIVWSFSLSCPSLALHNDFRWNLNEYK